MAGVIENWLGGVKERFLNPGKSILDMLSQAYGYPDTGTIRQIVR